MRNVEKSAETDSYDVYTLGGVMYVPHYANPAVFVGPGYDRTGIAYSSEFLTRAGAVLGSAMLWKRGYTGLVANVLN